MAYITCRLFQKGFLDVIIEQICAVNPGLNTNTFVIFFGGGNQHEVHCPYSSRNTEIPVHDELIREIIWSWNAATNWLQCLLMCLGRGWFVLQRLQR